MDFIGKSALLKDRVNPELAPDASIVIPVNAQKDMTPLRRVLSDLFRYSGKRQFEIILVINNYPVDAPPEEIQSYQQAGLQVIGIPHIVHNGGIAMAARIPGVRLARSQNVLHFDADCRIPHPDELLDWYVDRLQEGYELAYTHVDYTDLPPGISVKARMFVHHASRWIKRNILRIPTSRGSNYAMHRDTMLDLFAQGRIPYDLHVGPVVKSMGGRIAYSGAKEFVVLTSGRFFDPGWKVLFAYLIWRTGYYLRILKMKPKKIAPDQ
jgi:glycosyltransferase involved in cell wall biosynthesis